MRRAARILAGAGAWALLLVAAPSAASAQSAVVPVEIQIPRIQLSAAIVPVGLEEDGAMAAPTDPDTVGWYELGPGIGAGGNAILAGHVDWGGRLRAFGLLTRLDPGDVVSVAGGDGSWLGYRVVWSQMVDAETAPVEEIFAQSGVDEVTLITCGGIFDSITRQYLSRLVVRAVRDVPSAIGPIESQ